MLSLLITLNARAARNAQGSTELTAHIHIGTRNFQTTLTHDLLETLHSRLQMGRTVTTVFAINGAERTLTISGKVTKKNGKVRIEGSVTALSPLPGDHKQPKATPPQAPRGHWGLAHRERSQPETVYVN